MFETAKCEPRLMIMKGLDLYTGLSWDSFLESK